jgi:hypothetical protein
MTPEQLARWERDLGYATKLYVQAVDRLLTVVGAHGIETWTTRSTAPAVIPTPSPLTPATGTAAALPTHAGPSVSSPSHRLPNTAAPAASELEQVFRS